MLSTKRKYAFLKFLSLSSSSKDFPYIDFFNRDWGYAEWHEISTRYTSARYIAEVCCKQIPLEQKTIKKARQTCKKSKLNGRKLSELCIPREYCYLHFIGYPQICKPWANNPTPLVMCSLCPRSISNPPTECASLLLPLKIYTYSRTQHRGMQK